MYLDPVFRQNQGQDPSFHANRIRIRPKTRFATLNVYTISSIIQFWKFRLSEGIRWCTIFFCCVEFNHNKQKEKVVVNTSVGGGRIKSVQCPKKDCIDDPLFFICKKRGNILPNPTLIALPSLTGLIICRCSSDRKPNIAEFHPVSINLSLVRYVHLSNLISKPTWP